MANALRVAMGKADSVVAEESENQLQVGNSGMFILAYPITHQANGLMSASPCISPRAPEFKYRFQVAPALTFRM